MSNNTATMQESFPMTGGDGSYSYANNSYFQGIISEAQADSFNHPLYRPSLEQLTALVERNGCFSIERMELTNPASKLDGPMSGHAYTMHVRATIEGLVAKHFRSDSVDQLFHLFFKKIENMSRQLELDPKEEIQRFVVLKRK